MRVQLSCLHRAQQQGGHVGNAKAFARSRLWSRDSRTLNDQMIILVDMKLQLWIMLSGIGIDANSDEGADSQTSPRTMLPEATNAEPAHVGHDKFAASLFLFAHPRNGPVHIVNHTAEMQLIAFCTEDAATGK
ncbi:hypothetical protein GQ600_2639 [Phytophthora cactorum]|nr:hypothetical protein GQ600_2639 [Phytophthora cactorum]